MFLVDTTEANANLLVFFLLSTILFFQEVKRTVFEDIIRSFNWYLSIEADISGPFLFVSVKCFSIIFAPFAIAAIDVILSGVDLIN